MYDYQASAENLKKMTFSSPATGNCVNRMWQLPTSYHELVERRAASRPGLRSPAGFWPLPDHVASVVSGMYMGLDIFRQHGKKYGQALSDYYEYARDRDLYLTYAIISPQANAAKALRTRRMSLPPPLSSMRIVKVSPCGRQNAGYRLPDGQRGDGGLHSTVEASEEKYSFTAMVPLNAKE